jgi:hypothetical protein
MASTPNLVRRVDVRKQTGGGRRMAGHDLEPDAAAGLEDVHDRLERAFDRIEPGGATRHKIADDFMFQSLTAATGGLASVTAQQRWRVPKQHDST